MKKEYKRIKGVTKDLIGKEQHKKLDKIKDYKERTEGLKYLIGSKLKTIIIDLESKIKEIDKKESLLPEAKLSMLHSKIKIFESTHSTRDYDVVKNLIKEIEEELK